MKSMESKDWEIMKYNQLSFESDIEDVRRRIDDMKRLIDRYPDIDKKLMIEIRDNMKICIRLLKDCISR